MLLSSMTFPSQILCIKSFIFTPKVTVFPIILIIFSLFKLFQLTSPVRTTCNSICNYDYNNIHNRSSASSKRLDHPHLSCINGVKTIYCFSEASFIQKKFIKMLIQSATFKKLRKNPYSVIFGPLNCPNLRPTYKNLTRHF